MASRSMHAMRPVGHYKGVRCRNMWVFILVFILLGMREQRLWNSWDPLFKVVLRQSVLKSLCESGQGAIVNVMRGYVCFLCVLQSN